MSLMSPSLDIFSEPLEDTSIAQKHYISYNTNDIGAYGKDKTRYEIQVKDLDSWKNFSEAYLEYGVRLKQADGATNIATGENIALQSGHIWERAELYVDNQLVEQVNFASISSHIHFLASCSEDYKKTAGGQMNMENLDTNAGTASAQNAGWLQRQANGADGKLQNFYYKMRHLFGFGECQKVIKGMRITVVLHRLTHANMVFQDNAATNGTTVVIEPTMKLWIPIVTPSLESQVALTERLNSGAVQRLNWEARNCYRSGVIPAADTSFTYRVTTSIANPTHCFVVFQNVANDNNEEANNLHYTSNNITEIELRVNSVQVPREKLECDFSTANKNVNRAYQFFEDYKNQFNDTANGSLVSIKDFVGLTPIFHFDLRREDRAIFNVNGGADIELRGRKSGASADAYAYVLILSDREAVVTGASNNMRLELL